MTATRTLVMTGATRGIGRIAAERILELAPAVHLVVVAREPGGARLASEFAANGHAISTVPADLRSVRSVQHASAKIGSMLRHGALPPLYGFLGNAGVQYTDDLTEGPEGLEATFTVNVLANHLFIRSLEQHFASPSRITVTVSDTHFGDLAHNLGIVPGPVWQSPDRLARVAAFDRPATAAAGRTAYSTSKLAAIHLVHEHARRLPAGVEIVSYNPGFVPGTDLARNADPISRFIARRVMPLLTLTPLATTPSGAGRALADAALGTIAAPTGAYIDRTVPARSSDGSYDPSREAELWAALERLGHVPS